jgi:integrase/recombinase XerD
MISIESLAEDFYLDLKLKNRSAATLKNYRWYLARFLRYLRAEGISYPEQMTKEVLRGYQLHVYLSRGDRGETGSAWVNDYLSPVKSFLNFLKRIEILNGNPGDGLQFVPERRRMPKVILNAKEMVSLIESPDITTVLGYRDRTIMEVLYSTALRRNEMRDLKVQDIDFDEGLIRVFGKGQKERMVPCGRIALKFLDGYVRSVRPLLALKGQEAHLFLSSKGRRLSHDVIGDIINRYLGQAGIKKRVTPHTFRHTCATLMLRNRADIRHIQVLLGHESLNSTQIYTHVAVTDLRDVLRKYHPRERDASAALEKASE